MRIRVNKMERCLSPEQQKLVEDNHNLIYSFAHSRRLKLEQYYDVLAICLCNAACDYEKNKGEFSTLAYKYMENGVRNEINLQNLKRTEKDKTLLYFDAPISNSGEEGMSYFDTVKDEKIFENDSILFCTFQRLYSILDYREQEILKMLYQEYGRKEICNRLGIRSGSFTVSIRKIRAKLQKLLS